MNLVRLTPLLLLLSGWETGRQVAGLGVLRAASPQLRSGGVLLRPGAGADARSGHPVLQMANQTGSLEGGDVRSACQHLPQDPVSGCASVAGAKMRGGRPLPTPAHRRPNQRPVLPVLAFPEPGLDDTAAYQGYRTRFYRDSKNNTVQIYIQPRDSRVVLVWADGANESVGFTVRTAAGRPAQLEWSTDTADVADSAGSRTLEFRLTAGTSRIEVGWFLLGSMRVERDFVYAKRHLEPFTAPPFQVAQESLLVADVARLPTQERGRHLALLNAGTVVELRKRLLPMLSPLHTDTTWSLTAERPSLDGRNRLALELRVDPRRVKARLGRNTVSFETRPGSPVHLTVKVATDATPLTPLSRRQIFNRQFLDFLSRAGSERDSAGVVHYRRLERQVLGVELLSSEEKLMAGLPNFATYFGRDMMMTALMMRPIWSPEMAEHVIASVLRKLGPVGQVSHEEALGGQAIRENAITYDSLIGEYFGAIRNGHSQRTDSILDQARNVLRDLQATRENYHMIDDEFQLPVLVARYLRDSARSAARKRAFLADTSPGGTSRLALLLKELALVATETRLYVEQPRATNLVSFPKRDSVHWRSASWRDSDAGYGSGRFAMDVNAIWVPHALEAIALILATLPAIGITPAALDSVAPTVRQTVLGEYVRDSTSLRRAIEIWRKSRRHFEVTLAPSQVRHRVRSKLTWLPREERRYWERIVAGQPSDSFHFLALSLDSAGSRTQVVNTDPATELFLSDTMKPGTVLRDIVAFLRPYPIGLFVDGLGLLATNDAYATPRIWERFRLDSYHGPHVVWGREVNLFFIGLANQISGASKDAALESYVRQLDDALRRTLTAANASGLQHNELWSYQIKGGRLQPVRYGTSSDVQLWNTTDLVVEFVLSQLPH
jgi:hypothetical protein